MDCFSSTFHHTPCFYNNLKKFKNEKTHKKYVCKFLFYKYKSMYMYHVYYEWYSLLFLILLYSYQFCECKFLCKITLLNKVYHKKMKYWNYSDCLVHLITSSRYFVNKNFFSLLFCT